MPMPPYDPEWYRPDAPERYPFGCFLLLLAMMGLFLGIAIGALR